MNNTFSTAEFIKQLKSSDFAHSRIPMGYVPGLPILSISNGNLCMHIPFLRYKVTGKIDNTLVYPIKYVVSACIPEGTIVKYEDLAYNPAFNKVDFGNAIGTFRHVAVKHLDKDGFKALKRSLYEKYDKIIAFLTSGEPYSASDEGTFKSLLNQLLEPSLHPFYFALDNTFANKYLKYQ